MKVDVRVLKRAERTAASKDSTRADKSVYQTAERWAAMLEKWDLNLAGKWVHSRAAWLAIVRAGQKAVLRDDERVAT